MIAIHPVHSVRYIWELRHSGFTLTLGLCSLRGKQNHLCKFKSTYIYFCEYVWLDLHQLNVCLM
jgi:hypothetical protein